MTTPDASGTNARPGWTEDRVETLKKLWAEGLSASQIATRLAGGVTRNAVIGKVHRLGLSGRVVANRTAPQRPRKTRTPSQPTVSKPTPTVGATALKPQADTTPAPAPQPKPIRLVDPPAGERVNILMLSDKTCRWPMGDPGSEDFCFCGHSPRAGMPYCDYHASLAYQPVHDRKRRAANG